MTYRDIAREQLKVDEGVKSTVYKDSLGIETIGVGRNLRDVGLSPYEINVLLENDIARSEQDCKALFPSFDTLSDVRKAVLLNMAFNLGRDRLRKFAFFCGAVMAQDWNRAAAEMLDSKWATQVGERAKRLAKQMREG